MLWAAPVPPEGRLILSIIPNASPMTSSPSVIQREEHFGQLSLSKTAVYALKPANPSRNTSLHQAVPFLSTQADPDASCRESETTKPITRSQHMGCVKSIGLLL